MKIKICFIVWIVGVVLLLGTTTIDLYNLFVGAVIGGGAVTFLLTYVENM